MTSDDLTTQQARALGVVVRRQLRYLGRLRERMNRLSFPPMDPLFISVTEAYHAVHDLSVRLHYFSCSSGVGKPAKPPIIGG